MKRKKEYGKWYIILLLFIAAVCAVVAVIPKLLSKSAAEVPVMDQNTYFEYRGYTSVPHRKIHLNQKYENTQICFLKGAQQLKKEASAGSIKVDASNPLLYEELCHSVESNPEIRELDLNESGYSMDQVSELAERFPDIKIHYRFELFENVFDWESDIMILDGIPIQDLEPLRMAVRSMPNLRQIDMCGCGIDNETMDELRESMKPVKIVWSVDLKHWSLRTDAKYFASWRTAKDDDGYIISARNIGGNTSKSLEPLKYCIELEALDLGHNSIKDLGFLSSLVNLKYLIVALNKITDITPLQSLTELKYLEIFNNEIKDISALSSCSKLEALCMCGTSVTDISPLYGISSLRKLYLQGYRFKKAQRAEIAEALPDCDVMYKATGTSGSEWRRDNPYYKEMRLALGWRPDLVK